MVVIKKHFSHKHDLSLIDGVFNAPCSICSHLIHRDCIYSCRQCRYYIHRECAKFAEYIHHEWHPLHPLKLAKRSLNDNTCCYYCGNPFNNVDEYVYGCDDQLCSNFYMHRACAMIRVPTITSEVDGVQDLGMLQYVCHGKPMTLVEHLDDHKRKGKCFACQSVCSMGSAYSCTILECENFLHKSCEELSPKIQHPFHLHQPLIPQISKPRSCRSCCKKDCRLIFSCPEDECDFNLCIECVSLNTTIKCRSHDHSLSLLEKSSCIILCDACQKCYKDLLLNEIIQTQSFMFRCMDCVFNYHFVCDSLPSTIKYEYHMHCLILSDHSVSKNDSDEYYCEVCERKRDQSFRIYYCEECKCAAHIHCLLSEIMKVIKGDTDDVKLMALGDHRWDQYYWGHKLNKLTLKDIMDKLTQREKKMLIEPFTSDDDPSLKVFHRNEYLRSQRKYSRFNLEASNEDVDRLLQFFLFGIGDHDFGNFFGELYYFTVEEGLLKLLDIKYLRQQVADVAGYMIPKTLAPVLNTLLCKYGSLGGKESLSSAMRSISSTLLCIVIDKMYKTKMEDVTRDDLKYCSFYLRAIKYTTGFNIDQFSDDFGELKAFLGFEAMRYEKDTCKNLDNKIATLEAELERCKKNRDKLKTHGSHKSDLMKECLSEASERKHK